MGGRGERHRPTTARGGGGLIGLREDGGWGVLWVRVAGSGDSQTLLAPLTVLDESRAARLGWDCHRLISLVKLFRVDPRPDGTSSTRFLVRLSEGSSAEGRAEHWWGHQRGRISRTTAIGGLPVSEQDAPTANSITIPSSLVGPCLFPLHVLVGARAGGAGRV